MPANSPVPFMTGQTQSDPLNLTGWWAAPGAMNMDPYGGMPQTPGYIRGYDPKTMSLSDYLGSHYDHSGLDAFKDQALRQGPSTWAKLAVGDQAAQAAAQRDKAGAESSSATAKSLDELGASGGLSSGARERAVTEGGKNALSMDQSIDRQAGLNNLQIGMNDETNRIQQISQLPGMQQGEAQMFANAKGADVGNSLTETARQNAYLQNIYNQKMSTWAAGKQADATQNSGKQGMFK